jgi:uncharacterized protein
LEDYFMKEIFVPGIPVPLTWHNQPASWSLSPAGELTAAASAKTDWFIDPSGGFDAHSSAALLFQPHPVCQLSAYVTVDFNSLYDAGVLVAYQNEKLWGKLCLELSPQGKLMIVSVVTRGFSDDCNSYLVDGKSSYLRISRLGQAIAFHASPDGVQWNLIRHFTLDLVPDLKLGFMTQAPSGPGVSATFSHIHYAPQKLEDIRSGK